MSSPGGDLGPPAVAGTDRGPGSGPVVPGLVDGLLDDAAALHATSPGLALAAHREHRRAWYADLIGALVLPAGGVGELLAALRAPDLGLSVVLVADADDPRDALAALRAGRTALADDDRVRLVGVRLPLPLPAASGPGPGAVTRELLAVLDFTVTAWIAPPVAAGPGGPGPGPGPTVRSGWAGAQEAVAADGAESLALSAAVDPRTAAAFLRHAIDLGLATRLTDARGAAPGFLAAVCAVRAGVDGAGPDEIADVLSCADPAALAAALRRMDAGDAAATRAFLPVVETSDLTRAVADLAALGLLDVDR